MRITVRALAFAALWMMTSSVSQADVIYVDADTSNTTLADGTALVAGTHFLDLTGGGSVASDDLWDLRGFGNGVTVFSSNNSGGGESEDAPELRTTISGLTAGESYDVFSYFWGVDGGLWRGRTDLVAGNGSAPGYNTSHFNGSSFSPMSWITNNVSGGDNPQTVFTYDASLLTEEGNRALYEVSLGVAVADSNGEIQIFVDDLANTSSGNRTWYDGVGFQLNAVPEPSSGLVLIASAMGMFLVRRRQS